MATIGLYADSDYIEMINQKAHDMRISKSQLTRLAYDRLLGLSSPPKFGLCDIEVKPIKKQSKSE